MQNLGCQIERCERPTVAHGLCKPHYMRRPLTEITDADVEKFWTRVDRSDPNGCWPWRRGKCLGYGNHSIGGRIIWTHRFAWQITHGGRCLEIPKGMQVCHTCDYRTCCNPSHLFLGTATDNVHDMLAKGRARPTRGSRHYAAKLTEAQVRELRRRRQEGAKFAALAIEFGISESRASVIAGRPDIAWSHV